MSAKKHLVTTRQTAGLIHVTDLDLMYLDMLQLHYLCYQGDEVKAKVI